jgi:hypothetical protein
MSEEQTYDKCKWFGSKKYCPHINDEIMSRATQEIPRSYNGKPRIMQHFPADEEINEICGKCDKFTQK